MNPGAEDMGMHRIRTDVPRRLDPALVDCLASAGLGLHRKQVQLSSGSPRWAQAYACLELILQRSQPASVRALAHIGSTAVPGLVAKPILDLAIGLVPGADPAPTHLWLSELGFIYRGERNGSRPDAMYGFEIVPGIRLLNAHLIDHGSGEWNLYLSFRNHLRANAAERDAYIELKRSLAARNPSDRLAYVAGKTEFIRARSSPVLS